MRKREGREGKEEKYERGERNFRVKKEERESIKNYYFVFELSYIVILKVELHCSTIANIFCNS